MYCEGHSWAFLICNRAKSSYLCVILMEPSAWPSTLKAEAPSACLDQSPWGQSWDLITLLSDKEPPYFPQALLPVVKASGSAHQLEPPVDDISTQTPVLQRNSPHQVTWVSWLHGATCSLPTGLWALPGPPDSRRPCVFCRAVPSPSRSPSRLMCTRRLLVEWTVHRIELNKNLSRIVQEALEYQMRCHICPLQGLESSGASPFLLFSLHNTGMKGI